MRMILASLLILGSSWAFSGQSLLRKEQAQLVLETLNVMAFLGQAENFEAHLSVGLHPLKFESKGQQAFLALHTLKEAAQGGREIFRLSGQNEKGHLRILARIEKELLNLELTKKEISSTKLGEDFSSIQDISTESIDRSRPSMFKKLHQTK